MQLIYFGKLLNSVNNKKKSQLDVYMSEIKKSGNIKDASQFCVQSSLTLMD
jgi:hypothetical protein